MGGAYIEEVGAATEAGQYPNMPVPPTALSMTSTAGTTSVMAIVIKAVIVLSVNGTG